MKHIGRPKKIRKTQESPTIIRFSPRGRPGRPDEVFLEYDEFEAIRLKDGINLSHINSANQMEISRQTFGRSAPYQWSQATSCRVQG